MTKSSRRDFAIRLATAATAATAAAAALVPAGAGGAPPASPSPTPTPTPAPDVPSPLAEALAAAARIRFPGALSEDELQRVARSIENAVKNGERMRKVALTDADEPELVFSARVRS
jgi:hypothetical protein